MANVVSYIKTDRRAKEWELISFSSFRQEGNYFSASLCPSDWKAIASTLSIICPQRETHQEKISGSASGPPLITGQFTSHDCVSVSSSVKEDY